LIYPAVSSRVLSTFVCREVNGTNYLVADFTLNCYDDRWNTYLPFSVSMALLYPIGVPLLFFSLIRKYRFHPLSVVSIGFLYEAYETDTWYFEMVDMSVKLILTSILAFLPTGAQLPVGLVVIGLYLSVILIRRPYIRDLDDRLHMLALCEIGLLLLCGLTLETVGGFGENTGVDIALSTLLIAIILLTLGLFILNAVRFVVRLVRKYQNRVARLRESDTQETSRLFLLVVAMVECCSKRKLSRSRGVSENELMIMGNPAAADQLDVTVLEANKQQIGASQSTPKESARFL